MHPKGTVRYCRETQKCLPLPATTINAVWHDNKRATKGQDHENAPYFPTSIAVRTRNYRYSISVLSYFNFKQFFTRSLSILPPSKKMSSSHTASPPDVTSTRQKCLILWSTLRDVARTIGMFMMLRALIALYATRHSTPPLLHLQHASFCLSIFNHCFASRQPLATWPQQQLKYVKFPVIWMSFRHIFLIN